MRPASLRRTSADSFGGAAGAPRARSSSSSSSSSSGFLFSSFSFGGGSSSAAHVAEMSAPTATARTSSGKPFARSATPAALDTRWHAASSRSVARSGHDIPRGSSPSADVAMPPAAPPSPFSLRSNPPPPSPTPTVPLYPPKSLTVGPCAARSRGSVGWHPSSAGPSSSAHALKPAAATLESIPPSPLAPETTPRILCHTALANDAPSPHAPVASAPAGADALIELSAAARERHRPNAASAAALDPGLTPCVCESLPM